MHTPIIVGNSQLYFGKCEEVLKELPSNSVDTIITDPPYGLGFMGKKWDTFSPAGLAEKVEINKSHMNGKEIKRPANEAGRYDRSAQANRQFQAFMTDVFAEALRVAKPGAILMAFGGTRTYHRLTCAMEDAGWQIRDCLMWLFGSGFPKSHNIALSIDKKLGESNRGHRVATASRFHPDGTFEPNGEAIPAYKARTAIAKAWEGYGTGLKPAYEPIVVGMKPLDGTNAENALEHEVAGYWIDGARIGNSKRKNEPMGSPENSYGGYSASASEVEGRWPANVILDEESARLLDEQTGELSSGDPAGIKSGGQGNAFGEFNGGIPVTGFGDSGGASRFFYCAKTSREERDAGITSEPTRRSDGRSADSNNPRLRTSPRGNSHPTVKPLSLMRYLCRLTRPPKGGVVLDMFAGSGTTLIAADLEDRKSIGIEMTPEYIEIIKQRVTHWHGQKKQAPDLFESEEIAELKQGELF
jgi:DNA modification methylase